jgi:hypothetical protein
MSATPDNTLADPEQLIADLQRQLSECKAERDEALQRETATDEHWSIHLGRLADFLKEQAGELGLP